MHAPPHGQSVDCDTPKAITESRHAKPLEEAFVAYLPRMLLARNRTARAMPATVPDQAAKADESHQEGLKLVADLRRMLTLYAA